MLLDMPSRLQTHLVAVHYNAWRLALDRRPPFQGTHLPLGFRPRITRMFRTLVSHYLLQVILIGFGVAVAIVYLAFFDNPPYPALVPVALWFFILSYLSALWVLRAIGKEAAAWQHYMSAGIAIALTLAIYLAGHVSEQMREIELQERQLSD